MNCNQGGTGPGYCLPTERTYSAGNWAHEALLLMDEAESLIRWGCVSSPDERYTPAAKAFWKVCHMLAKERARLHETHNVEVTGAARLYRAASGGLPGSAYTRRVATAMHEDLCDVLREHGKNSEMYARQLGKASRVLRRTLPEILEVFVGYSSSSLR